MGGGAGISTVIYCFIFSDLHSYTLLDSYIIISTVIKISTVILGETIELYII